MAYLSPKKLTCPSCAFADEVTIVVGVGPGSRRGDIAQRYYRDPEAFVEAKNDDGVASLFCPSCGTLVWANTRSQRAFGPLTQKEMQGVHGRNWLVPGTENPFPPKPVKFNPRDPFSGPQPVKPPIKPG